jgi:signal recognition particle receptor subunit beta
MGVYKIIFTGPVGAGKTTSIAAISDVEPFVTEQIATDETKNRKEQTTVAMDYGMLKLDNNERIHLYGTPGQERFNFMWDILTDGGVGLVLLIDNKRANPLDDFAFFLESFKDFVEQTAVVVGITRMDMAGKPSLEDYHRVMRELNMNIPIFEVDARERKDVIYLVQTLLYCLDPQIAA